MEWINDPTVWVGLLTLIGLEIVLGIDNLVFIAILSDKLAPEHRQRARLIGLSLALVMRLGLLAGISWVMSLSEPVVSFWRFSLSWRDLILIAGGAFLLVKATTEIHERVDGGAHRESGAVSHAAFWPVVAQIVALDLVFSLDSVITAVGMVDELYVMMALTGRSASPSTPPTMCRSAAPNIVSSAVLACAGAGVPPTRRRTASATCVRVSAFAAGCRVRRDASWLIVSTSRENPIAT